MNAAQAGVIYEASVLVIKGKLTVGEITTFLLFMIQLIINFATISFTLAQVFVVVGASKKIVELMQYKSQINTRGGI